MSDDCVFVVDDDADIRDSMRVLLEVAGFKVRTFTSAKQFLADDHAKHGCLIADVRMPDMSGLELQQELNRRGAVIPVIFATGVAEIPVAVEAMQHGAFDYLQKPISQEDLLDRVRRALSFDATTRASLLERRQAEERFESLTEREREILGMVVSGLSNKEAAARMKLSARTVEIHRAHIMNKLHASSLSDLVRIVLVAEDGEGPPMAVGGKTKLPRMA